MPDGGESAPDVRADGEELIHCARPILWPRRPIANCGHFPSEPRALPFDVPEPRTPAFSRKLAARY